MAPVAAPAAGMTAAEAIMWGTGIQAGTQLLGGVMGGAADADAQDEARARMTYYGVSGKGDKTDMNIGGLLGKVQLSPMSSIAGAGAYEPWTPSTLDDLTKTVGG